MEGDDRGTDGDLVEMVEGAGAGDRLAVDRHAVAAPVVAEHKVTGPLFDEGMLFGDHTVEELEVLRWVTPDGHTAIEAQFARLSGGVGIGQFGHAKRLKNVGFPLYARGD